MKPAVYEQLINGGWETLDYSPFRPGVSIHRLWQAAETGAEWAVLKYQPGASVPRHRHPGVETILVLDGAQSDEHGTYSTGDMICNAPGSVHSVWSEPGCVVLIFWALPIELLDDAPRGS